ncbi:MAG: very short patch repair endonuclease [Limisphaerales bacterium]
MDTFDKITRLRIMAAVRSKGNKSTESRFRAILAASGLRGWQMQVQSLPGRPDFTFKRKKIAIFVDGCFWHGCPKCYRRPKSKRSYWDAKVERNRLRDQKNRQSLRKMGWVTLRLWEHQVLKSPTSCLQKLSFALNAH